MTGASAYSQLLPMVLDVVSDAVFIVRPNSDHTFTLVESNRTFHKFMGRGDVLNGLRLQAIFSSEDHRWLRYNLLKVYRTKEAVIQDVTSDNLPGGVHHLRVKLVPMCEHGVITYIIGTVEFLTNDVKSRQLAQDHKERYISAMEYAPYGTCFVDDNGAMHMVNRALCRWLDRPLSRLLNASAHLAIHPDDRAIFEKALSKVVKGGYAYKGLEIRLNARRGQTVWVSLSMSRVADAHGAAYTILQFVDVSDRKRHEERLEKQANEDHLTGLYNRKVFEEGLRKALKNARRYNRSGAVLYLDLDDFKAVNDLFGHKAGDAVLQEVGHVLKRLFRETDIAARLGGDEFAVIMDEVDEKEAHQKARMAEQALRNLRVEAHGRTVGVSASLGVQLFGGAHNELSYDDIVEGADKAMYANKNTSKRRQMNA